MDIRRMHYKGPAIGKMVTRGKGVRATPFRPDAYLNQWINAEAQKRVNERGAGLVRRTTSPHNKSYWEWLTGRSARAMRGTIDGIASTSYAADIERGERFGRRTGRRDLLKNMMLRHWRRFWAEELRGRQNGG